MYRKIYSLFALLFVFLWNVRFASSLLTKCCPLQYELSVSSLNSEDRVVSYSDVNCVKSSSNTLIVSRPANLTTGLPNCTRFKFVQVYDKTSRVHCVDRVQQFKTIFGVLCEDEPNVRPTFTIPSIANFRKCCPPNRKYDAEKQFCWNHLAENNTNALTDVLKLAIRENNALVNVSYGNPPCRRTDALVDRLESFQKIRFTESEGVQDSSGLLWSFDEYCLDVVDDLFEYLVLRSCRDQHIVCGSNDIMCYRKCCPAGYEVKKKRCQPSTKALSLAFHNGTEVLADIRPAVLQGDRCEGGKYIVPEDEAKKYLLTADGRVHNEARNSVIGLDEYCFDTVDQQEGTRLFICFAEEWQHPSFRFEVRVTLTMACAATSALFLLFTFIIYAILPSLKNAHCRLIMCYLFTSMLSYIIVVVQGILPSILNMSPIFCKILGYSMLFTFLSSFSWLNIISFDIWSTFRAVESSFFKKSKTSKRFFLFCLYGWGFAAGWTALAVFCQFTTSTDMPEILKPDIGKLSCWFSNYGLSRIPFFIVPMSAMVTFNLVLFIVTVKYCAQIKSELQMSHSRNNNYSIKKYTADMNEFIINFKLFILMGLNWIMELISLTVQPENRIFFLISDITNALEGIIIFCLFVLKRKVLRDLRKTFFGEHHPQRSHDRAATLTTCTSSSIVQSMINSRDVNTTP